MKRWMGAVVSFASVCMVGRSGFAQAQESLDVTRRELLQQAQHAAEAGHSAQALDLATRAGQIGMTPSLRSFLAQQQLANHLPVEALGSAQTCIREATGAATLNNREQILSACRTVVTAAAPQIGHVNIHLPPQHAGAIVTLGGTTLNEAVLGIPFAVDPGPVTIEATAPGMLAFHATVQSSAGQTVDVPVVWTPEPTHGTTTTLTDSTTHPEPLPERHPLRVESHGGPPVPAIVLLVGGGALLIAGGIFVGLYANDVGQLNNPSNCVPDGMGGYSCYPGAAGLRSDGATFGTLGIIGLSVGAAAAGAGIVWWAVSGRHVGERAPQAFVVPMEHGAIVGIGGAL